MKRSKKLLINMCIIAVLLSGFYYFGGYYISKEQCMMEMLRSYYCNEREVAMEFENNNIITTVVVDIEGKTFSALKVKKIGFLYQPTGSAYGQEISEEYKISVNGHYTKGDGMEIFVYRNDDTVERVEVTMEDSVIVLDEWENNFAWFVKDTDGWKRGTYRAYNASNEIIEEMQY